MMPSYELGGTYMIRFIRKNKVFPYIICTVLMMTGTVRADDEPSQPVLLFGDSIVAGYGLETEDALAAQINIIFEREGKQAIAINGGVSGDTTKKALNRLEWTLNQYEPEIVVIAVGSNDVLRGVPPRETRRNVADMLHLLKERNIITLLSAVRAPLNVGIAYSVEFNRIYPELADEYDVPLYPFFLDGLYGKKEVMQGDGIHPNAQGVALIADGLATYLMEEWVR